MDDEEAERLDRAVSAVAYVVSAVIVAHVGGGLEAERRFALAVRRRLGELVAARRAAGRRRLYTELVANEVSVVALCAVAAEPPSSASATLGVACCVNRAARAAAVRAWERALGQQSDRRGRVQ